MQISFFAGSRSFFTGIALIITGLIILGIEAFAYGLNMTIWLLPSIFFALGIVAIIYHVVIHHVVKSLGKVG